MTNSKPEPSTARYSTIERQASRPRNGHPFIRRRRVTNATTTTALSGTPAPHASLVLPNDPKGIDKHTKAARVQQEKQADLQKKANTQNYPKEQQLLPSKTNARCNFFLNERSSRTQSDNQLPHQDALA